MFIGKEIVILICVGRSVAFRLMNYLTRLCRNMFYKIYIIDNQQKILQIFFIVLIGKGSIVLIGKGPLY